MTVKYVGESNPLSLTNGKLYEVLAIEGGEWGWFRVIDNSMEDYLYPPECFEIVDDTPIPPNALEKALAVLKRREQGLGSTGKISIAMANETCKVSIGLDESFIIGSGGKFFNYDIVLNPLKLSGESYRYNVFSIFVNLFSRSYSMALIGDAYSLDKDCALLREDILTVLLNQRIIQIDLLAGKIVRQKDLDTSGCNFAIYRTEKGNIIYGETNITMLDEALNKKWTFSGMDIFVSITGKNPFELKYDRICLYDFYDHYYEVDYDGNLLCSIKA